MVIINFKVDNNGNNNGNKKAQDGLIISFECEDTSKTIKELLIDFIKSKNSYLKIAQKDISKFEENFGVDILMFIYKSKLLNQKANLNKEVKHFFKTDNNTVLLRDIGDILGGKENFS